MALSTRESMALDLAGRYYRYGAAREDDIRRELGMSLAQHGQMVARLLERADAEEAHPQLVRRLRRLRDRRRSERRVA